MKEEALRRSLNVEICRETRIKIMAWVRFSETNLPHCFFHAHKPAMEYLSKMNVYFKA